MPDTIHEIALESEIERAEIMSYDRYTDYHQPYNPRDAAASFEDAQETLARQMEGVAAGDLQRVPGGFIDGGSFVIHPIIGAHTQLAEDQAKAQFKGWPVMPEDPSVGMRYPGIDPVGKYSVIDMKFAQREAKIEAALQTRAPEAATYARQLLNACKGGAGNDKEIQLHGAMKMAAQKHRITSRAAKLCHNADGRHLLDKAAREMEASEPVVQYDKYLQGIEYAAGVRTGPVPAEITAFFAEQVGKPLDMEKIAAAKLPVRAPAMMKVEFQDLDNRLLQYQFAKPENWGKTQAQAELVELDAVEVDRTVEPYARASADRVIDPLFRGVEEKFNNQLGLSRGDLIIVGGKTVREIAAERFFARTPGGLLENFNRDFAANQARITNEIVAAGLMADQRVEAFLPDANGNIPKEPTQITKTGYEPSPLKKVTLNGWERFWSKRGFYKEKTAAAVEYQRTLDARERVQAYHDAGLYQLDSIGSARIRDSFVGDEVRKAGSIAALFEGRNPDGIGYSVTRSALTTVPVLHMLREGRTIEDLMDPSKLVAEKQAAGRLVVEKMKAGDHQWLNDCFIDGGRKLIAETERLSKTVDLTDPKAMMSPAARPLRFAGRVGFDAYQEMNRDKKFALDVLKTRYPDQDPNTAFRQLEQGLFTMTGYTDFIEKSQTARVSIMLGDRKPTTVTNYIFNCSVTELAARSIRAGQAAAPAGPYTKTMDLMEADLFSRAYSLIGRKSPDQPPVSIHDHFDDMARAMLSDPAKMEVAMKGLASGQLQKSMEFRVDMEKMRDFGVKLPSLDSLTKALKDAGRMDTMAANARSNAAKAAEKRDAELATSTVQQKPAAKKPTAPARGGRTK